MVAPIEHRVIAKTPLGAEFVVENFGHHSFTLGVVIAAANNSNRIAIPQLRPQCLIHFVGVVGDNGIGRFEDARGGAVVLLELDQF